MNSRGPSKCLYYQEFHSNSSSVIMSGDFKVVCMKQVFHFNSVHINKVPLYSKSDIIVI